MSAIATPVREWTYADYLALPDNEDGLRYEILDGDLVVMDSPTPTHQEIVGFIFRRMSQFVEAQKLGKVYIAPLDVVFAPKAMTQPDIIFISHERAQIITTRNISGVPDLVVEVASPSTQRTDRTRKFRLYARFGVREYWIVDRDTEAIDIFTLDAGHYREVESAAGEAHSEVLSGFVIALKELFA